MKKYVRILILSLLVGMPHTAAALERTRLGLVEEGEFSLLTGLDYQEGDYGSPDSTSLWRVPVSVSYRQKRFGVFASVPFLHATSDGVINVASRGSTKGMGGGLQSTIPAQQTESGIGDIIFSGSYYFTPDYINEIAYRLTGIVKLGTADETKGLGTGENDFSIEGGVTKDIDEYVLAGTLGYEVVGDPSDFDYDNIFYGELGLTRQLSGNRKVGTSLFYSQARSSIAEEPVEISFFYRQPVANNRDVYIYFSKGMSDGSPDFSLGGNIQFYY